MRPPTIHHARRAHADCHHAKINDLFEGTQQVSLLIIATPNTLF